MILIHLRKLQRSALLFSRGDKDERVGAMRDAPQQIINAIALVHKGLYEGDDLRRINMIDFLNQLVRHMSKAMGLDQSDIKVQLNIDEQELDADTAIPVALFMIEALTNSSRHGSAPGRKAVLPGRAKSL